MKEIAIISLTRFGDLIQGTPLLRILKRSYPGARITLIVEQRFAGILPLVRGFDRVITFAKNALADMLVFDNDPLVPYFFVEKFVCELELTHYDLVINLTFSPMSAFLASLMNAETSVGSSPGKKGRGSSVPSGGPTSSPARRVTTGGSTGSTWSIHSPGSAA
jgi:ADP-heptose:LPS heptosyltransferase